MRETVKPELIDRNSEIHDISQRMNFSYNYNLENKVSDWISQNTNLIT